MMLIISATIFMILCFRSILFFDGVHCVSFVEENVTTTIKTKDGQVFNCVPFDKQPTFNDSTLKPEVITKVVGIQAQNHSHFESDDFGLEGDGCPLGTVPILDDASWKSSPGRPISLTGVTRREHCVAIIRTKANDAKKFTGTIARLSLNRPKVESNQWSSGRMKLINGGESIEAGWMVNPEVFKDEETHFYTKFSVGGKECINTQCPGFVQVNNKMPLGTIQQYSKVDGNQYMMRLMIKKHADDGHWWLSFRFKDGEYFPIGYWPKTLFSSMSKFANQIEWGGEINNPGASKHQPQMGSGVKPSNFLKYCAYLRNVEVYDENFQAIEPEDVEKEANCKQFYWASDHGHPGHDWGRVFVYGGPAFSFCLFC